MKTRTFTGVLLVSLMTYGIAGAWGIPKLSNIPGAGGGSASAGDPDAFLIRARAAEVLVNRSADQLFGLVASKEEQAKAEEKQKQIDATTDAKEKDALVCDLRSSELAAISTAAADKKLEADAKHWDAKKKKLAACALFNLALGGKLAADLVPQGQKLATSIASNPMMLAKANSLYESGKSLAGIGTGTVKLMTALPPVFLAAKIDAKLPTSSADTPKSVDLD